jgi:hypothetical protein
VACLVLPCFSTLSHNQQFSGEKKNTAHKMCVLISLKLLPEKFLILGKIQQDITTYTILHVKYMLFLSDFNLT